MPGAEGVEQAAADPSPGLQSHIVDVEKAEPSPAPEQPEAQPLVDNDEHKHYSSRAPWLRAGVLGANDGLVSVASLMLGVGGGSDKLHYLVLAGLAGLVGGALSMACGESISVASQRDSEQADVDKEKAEQAKGPEARAHELEELTQIYEDRGLSRSLACQVAAELTAKDVIKAHARDELGIDLDDLSNPVQAACASAFAFSIGAGLPLLGGAFLADYLARMLTIVAVSTVGLVSFGVLGALLGGASAWRGGLRVVIGGWVAMGITFGLGRAFGGASL